MTKRLFVFILKANKYEHIDLCVGERMGKDSWPRVIIHADLNSFYASVECLYRPQIREKPVVVGGDEEARHGIVLTKNQVAKKFGIQTGMSLMEARRLCPSLVTVQSDMPLYLRFSKEFREILSQYSDCVEPYGLDEAWVELTDKGVTIQDGERIANEIRKKALFELGITCSIGVSFTKPFAKLGSDIKKPDATTVLSKENYQKTVWPLPASELLFVGPATTKTLARYSILTIGDLASCDTEWIYRKLGKNGLLIQSYAKGEDFTPVKPCDVINPIKSVGNSTTLPVDATSIEQVKATFAILADSVAHRMREEGFRSRCINIAVRGTNLEWSGCQRAIKTPTCLASDLRTVAMDLFYSRQYQHLLPLRGVSLRCTMLSHFTDPMQTDMFYDIHQQEVRERLERAIRFLQDRFGSKSIQLGIMMADKKIARVNPKELHVAPAAPYYH